MVQPKDMWRCQIANCNYVYNPEEGDAKANIQPVAMFEDLPEDWVCPICGASKKSFRRVTDTSTQRFS